VPVRIALPADGPLARKLRPGLSVTVSIDTRAEPVAALGADPAGPRHIVGSARPDPAAAGAAIRQ
jgi:membrane fusion protein (multidrug efflux system)